MEGSQFLLAPSMTFYHFHDYIIQLDIMCRRKYRNDQLCCIACWISEHVILSLVCPFACCDLILWIMLPINHRIEMTPSNAEKKNWIWNLLLTRLKSLLNQAYGYHLTWIILHGGQVHGILAGLRECENIPAPCGWNYRILSEWTMNHLSASLWYILENLWPFAGGVSTIAQLTASLDA